MPTAHLSDSMNYIVNKSEYVLGGVGVLYSQIQPEQACTRGGPGPRPCMVETSIWTETDRQTNTYTEYTTFVTPLVRGNNTAKRKFLSSRIVYSYKCINNSDRNLF